MCALGVYTSISANLWACTGVSGAEAVKCIPALFHATDVSWPSAIQLGIARARIMSACGKYTTLPFTDKLAAWMARNSKQQPVKGQRGAAAQRIPSGFWASPAVSLRSLVILLPVGPNYHQPGWEGEQEVSTARMFLLLRCLARSWMITSSPAAGTHYSQDEGGHKAHIQKELTLIYSGKKMSLWWI